MRSLFGAGVLVAVLLGGAVRALPLNCRDARLVELSFVSRVFASPVSLVRGVGRGICVSPIVVAVSANRLVSHAASLLTRPCVASFNGHFCWFFLIFVSLISLDAYGGFVSLAETTKGLGGGASPPSCFGVEAGQRGAWYRINRTLAPKSNVTVSTCHPATNSVAAAAVTVLRASPSCGQLTCVAAAASGAACPDGTGAAVSYAHDPFEVYFAVVHGDGWVVNSNGSRFGWELTVGPENCVEGCTEHGRCTAGACECSPMSTGVDCSKRATDIVLVDEQFSVDWARLTGPNTRLSFYTNEWGGPAKGSRYLRVELRGDSVVSFCWRPSQDKILSVRDFDAIEFFVRVETGLLSQLNVEVSLFESFGIPNGIFPVFAISSTWKHVRIPLSLLNSTEFLACITFSFPPTVASTDLLFDDLRLSLQSADSTPAPAPTERTPPSVNSAIESSGGRLSGMITIIVMAVGALLLCGLLAVLMLLVWRRQKRAQPPQASSSQKKFATGSSMPTVAAEPSGKSSNYPLAGSPNRSRSTSSTTPIPDYDSITDYTATATDYSPIVSRAGGELSVHGRPRAQTCSGASGHNIDHLFLGEQWLVEWDELTVGHELGRGSGGVVYHARLRGQDVAVKALHSESVNQKQIDDFVGEIEVMRQIPHHSNVVHMQGMCREPLALITSFEANGSLIGYLREHGILDDYLTLSIAHGIIKGMLHLHTSHIVHRDLAARNILLDADLSAKITDFGYSRFLAEADESARTEATVGPLKWMAPEALFDKLYSKESDVWSFAVCLSELVTGGAPPYGELSGAQVAGRMALGKISLLDTLPVEVSINGILLRMMQDCLKHDASHRPTFRQLHDRMTARVFRSNT